MQRRIGGGLCAAVAVALGVIAQLSGWRLPDAVSAILLIVCAIVFIFGLMLAFWPEKVSRSQPAPRRRDVNLSEALAYAAQGEWGLDVMGVAGEVFAIVGEAVHTARQLARDGDIVIWGKISQRGIYEVIPAEYWRDHQIEWFDMLRGMPRTEATTPGAPLGIYYDLMVSKADFSRHFPR